MNNTKQLVFSALFTALIIAGSYIRVPVGPVPIALASMFVLLAGFSQSFRWAIASVSVYLVLGAIGLPVFTSGGGFAYFVGPTGGYLIGYLAATAVTNMVSTGRPGTPVRDLSAITLGTLAIYVIGVPWLKIALDLTWKQALASGVIPFLIGDIIKIAVVYSSATAVKRMYPELMPRYRVAEA